MLANLNVFNIFIYYLPTVLYAYTHRKMCVVSENTVFNRNLSEVSHVKIPSLVTSQKQV